MSNIEKLKNVKLKEMRNYLVTYFNVNPKTFKRSKVTAIVTAYDQQHAIRIIDRHPSLIQSIKPL